MKSHPSNIDQKLAKSIGRELNNGSFRGFTEGDKLMEILHIYAGNARNESIADEVTTSKLWSAIESQIGTTIELTDSQTIQKSESSVADTFGKITPITRYRQTFQHYRWIAAAAVIALVIWSVLRFGALLLPSHGELPIAFATTHIVTHTFENGSVVTLRPNSSIYLDFENDSEVRYRLVGEAFFEVEGDGRQMFTVKTGNAVVEVLGTRFNVRGWSAYPEVYVEKGRVFFGEDVSQERLDESGSSVADRSSIREGRLGVELGAGEAGRRTDVGAWVRSEVGAEVALGWLNSEILFSERTLGDIVKELEHHFGIVVRFDENLRNESISGRIHLENARQALRDLSLVSGTPIEIASGR